MSVNQVLQGLMTLGVISLGFSLSSLQLKAYLCMVWHDTEKVADPYFRDASRATAVLVVGCTVILLGAGSAALIYLVFFPF